MAALNDFSPTALTAGIVLFSALFLSIAYPDRYVTTCPRSDLVGPKGVPIVGNLFQVIPRHRHMLGWFKQLNDTYGPVSTFTLPPWGRGILINRPEWLLYVKQADMQKYSRGPVARALFTEFPGAKTPVASEGAGWRLARKSMYPIFTVKSFTEHVSSAMDTIVPTARTFLLNASKKNITVDWNDLAGRIALSIFSHSAFTLDTGALTTDPSIQGSDDMRDALLSLNLISARRLFNPFWHWIEYVTGDRFRFNRARSYIRNVVLQMVEARRAEIRDIPTGERPNDFLTALLEDPAFDDPVQIRDTLVTLLFAGRDNTQNVLAWGLHALMSAPEWIERLRAEATNNAAEDHELRYSDLSRYPVHLAVFYETVRLWPGLPKNARLALCDDVLPALPEHGIPAVKIEKGDYVFWSDYNIMRDEAVWGVNSNTFDPSRHLASDGSFIRPAQPKFNGFGAGPRLCPAAQLATYEFVATMAGILPFFDFEPSKAPGLYEEPSMNESFTSSLAGPLWVDVRVRKGMD
ncbi:cytochrome P450 [Peniophora sp. CONT]|nr:cytochrome P450 [Peniophora sp. CONT]